MKNQIHVFNSMLLSYNRYVRKLRRLIVSGLNFRKQEILEKRIGKLFTKLHSLQINLKRTASIASLVGVSIISESNLALSQNFQPAIINPYGIPSNFGCLEIEFVDIDNDGDQDFFARVPTNSFPLVVDFYYFQNIGSPTNPQFGTPLINPSWLQTFVFPSEFIDIDVDGDLDFFGDDKSFVENIGTSSNPNFVGVQPSPVTFDTESYVPRFADLDGDGDFDCTLLNTYYEPYDGGYYLFTKLNYYENIGSPNIPNLSLVPQSLGICRAYYYDFGDLDMDGDLDIIGSRGSTSPILYKENIGNVNTPTFNIDEYNVFGLPSYPDQVVYGQDLVDLNADGNLDLILSLLSGIDESTAIYFLENKEICATVDDLLVTTKQNGYKLGWEAVEGSTKCEIKGGKANGQYTASYTKYGNEPTSVFLNFSQIKPNTDYFYQVRCNCEANDDFGSFSNPYPFTTGSNPNMNFAKSDSQMVFEDNGEISETNANVEIFPNPATDNLTIKIELGLIAKMDVKVIDMTGRLVLTAQKAGAEGMNTFNLDVTKLHAGMYFIEIGNEKKIFAKK